MKLFLGRLTYCNGACEAYVMFCSKFDQESIDNCDTVEASLGPKPKMPSIAIPARLSDS